MGLVINSANIIEFDYSVNYNLNSEEVTMTSETTYQTGGAANVIGINFSITSPSGDTYYDNTNFLLPDISPSAQLPFSKDMITFAGAVQYGVWTIVGSIKDQDGTIYTWEKTREICKPKTNSSTQGSDSYATVSVSLDCNQNLLIYQDSTTYTYQSVRSTSVVYSGIMQYPSNAELSNLAFTSSFFVDSPVYDGSYIFTVDNVATYDFDDLQSVTIAYTATKTFKAQCVSLCNIRCAFEKYFQVYTTALANGSKNINTIKDNMLSLVGYIKSAEFAISCGGDASDSIAAIEDITGYECDCGCGQGVARGVFTMQNVIVKAGAGDITVSTSTVGKTTTFTINDITYVIETNTSGVTITTETVGGVNTYTIDVCVDVLPICNSITIQGIDSEDITNPVSQGFPSGSLLSSLFAYISTQFENIRTYFETPLTWQDIILNSSDGWVASADTPQFMYDSINGWFYLRGVVGHVSSVTTGTSTAVIGNIAQATGHPISLKFPIVAQNSAPPTSLDNDFFLEITTSGDIKISSLPTSQSTGAFLDIFLTGINFNISQY
jgi:hypothetical protein